jgi:hypothetical protein
VGGWSRYQTERLGVEARALAKNHTNMQFEVLWTQAVARFWYWQSERWFLVRMEVPNTYPDEMPVLYIQQPRPLLDGFGDDMNRRAPSHNWHLLAPSDAGEVRICHFRDEDWNELKSLHLVVLKAKLWLDAYCLHLRTLQPICAFFHDCT